MGKQALFTGLTVPTLPAVPMLGLPRIPLITTSDRSGADETAAQLALVVDDGKPITRPAAVVEGLGLARSFVRRFVTFLERAPAAEIEFRKGLQTLLSEVGDDVRPVAHRRAVRFYRSMMAGTTDRASLVRSQIRAVIVRAGQHGASVHDFGELIAVHGKASVMHALRTLRSELRFHGGRYFASSEIEKGSTPSAPALVIPCNAKLDDDSDLSKSAPGLSVAARRVPPGTIRTWKDRDRGYIRTVKMPDGSWKQLETISAKKKPGDHPPQKHEAKHIASQGHFSVLGGDDEDEPEQKPKHKEPVDLPDPKHRLTVEQRHRRLKQELERRGFSFSSAHKDDADKRAHLVLPHAGATPRDTPEALVVHHDHPAERAEVREIARKHGETSVIHSLGGHHEKHYVAGPLAGKHRRGQGADVEHGNESTKVRLHINSEVHDGEPVLKSDSEASPRARDSKPAARQRRKLYMRSERGHHVDDKAHATYDSEHPERTAAHDAARSAHDGESHKCARCGEPATHKHHTDYSKPTQVEWLCHKHHVKAHHPKSNITKSHDVFVPAVFDLDAALSTLREELQAIDDYKVRIDNAGDPELARVIEHARDEEKHHAKLVSDWLREQETNP